MLYNYEKKGFIVLMIIVISLIILPRQLKKKDHSFFLLPDLIPVEYNKNKKEKSILIELNSTDSVTLTTIKGIGPVYASRIIQYRNLLGGYSDIKQLKELNLYYLNVESVFHYFSVDKSLIEKRSLDSLSFREVLSHPYLNYENTKHIFDAKNKFSSISIRLLETHHILPDSILIKIEPYFQ